MSAKQNFLAAHWDWLVALVGVASLGVALVFLMMSLGSSPEADRDEYEVQLKAQKPAHEGVAPANLDVFDKALRIAKKPPALDAVDPKKPSFLASERRVFCQQGDSESKQKACGKPIPADCEVCPFCGAKQNVVRIEADSDHDGLPNEWEKKYGLNPNDPADAAKDSDGDGFTNLEEFEAKTDPTDPESHPDYLNFVSVSGALKEMKLPFYFNTYNPIPGGYRFTFWLLVKTSKFSGNKVSAKLNEDVMDSDSPKAKSTGWKVIGFEKKTEKRVVKGSGGLKKEVDLSFVTIQRAKDGKKLSLPIGQREVSIESEAEISYSRGAGRKITVSAGAEFELNGRKYRVVKLRAIENGCEVTIQDLKTKKEKTIH